MIKDNRKHNGKNLNKYKGKLHSNWRGGITKDTKLKYKLKKLRHPEKLKAQGRLSWAIYTGKIIKPNKCSKCNNKLKKRQIQGHHKDYNKPLDVVWLCNKCHNYIHRGHTKS